MDMPSTNDAISIFVSAMRIHVSDYARRDIDGNAMSARASQSYWVDQGWIADRWKDHGLPQIAVFTMGGGVIGEGTTNERYEQKTILVDIFASGRQQKDKISEQVKNGFLLNVNRNSINSSGVKIDRFLSESDSIDDEMVPQDVYRKSLTFRIIYRASGV